ncbi:carbohydrate sulfotransferase 1-like [Glandiceps talaboti]
MCHGRHVRTSLNILYNQRVTNRRFADFYLITLQNNILLQRDADSGAILAIRGIYRGNDVISYANASVTNKSIQVIIFASKRTGSSFVGELFNQNKNFFYLFEPLEIYTHSVLEKKLSKHLFDSKSIDTLHRALTCDFKSTPPEWNLNLHTNCNFGIATSKSVVCNGLRTTKKFPKTKRQIQTRLTNICNKYQHKAAKIIRIYDINLLRQLIVDQRLNARVLHLVRDPRAVFNSRSTLQMVNKDFTRRGGGDEILQYCEDVERNLMIARNSPDVFNDKYLIVRYEDVASDPLTEMRRMYKYFDLDEDESVIYWISNNTDSNAKSKFSTSKKSQQTVEQWRTTISMDEVLTIQRKCGNMMEMLGYQNVSDISHLRNLENTLLSRVQSRLK